MVLRSVVISALLILLGSNCDAMEVDSFEKKHLPLQRAKSNAHSDNKKDREEFPFHILTSDILGTILNQSYDSENNSTTPIKILGHEVTLKVPPQTFQTIKKRLDSDTPHSLANSVVGESQLCGKIIKVSPDAKAVLIESSGCRNADKKDILYSYYLYRQDLLVKRDPIVILFRNFAEKTDNLSSKDKEKQYQETSKTFHTHSHDALKHKEEEGGKDKRSPTKGSAIVQKTSLAKKKNS